MKRTTWDYCGRLGGLRDYARGKRRQLKDARRAITNLRFGCALGPMYYVKQIEQIEVLLDEIDKKTKPYA